MLVGPPNSGSDNRTRRKERTRSAHTGRRPRYAPMGNEDLVRHNPLFR
jgi:hypothetical protein